MTNSSDYLFSEINTHLQVWAVILKWLLLARKHMIHMELVWVQYASSVVPRIYIVSLKTKLLNFTLAMMQSSMQPALTLMAAYLKFLQVCWIDFQIFNWKVTSFFSQYLFISQIMLICMEVQSACQMPVCHRWPAWYRVKAHPHTSNLALSVWNVMPILSLGIRCYRDATSSL